MQIWCVSAENYENKILFSKSLKKKFVVTLKKFLYESYNIEL